MRHPSVTKILDLVESELRDKENHLWRSICYDALDEAGWDICPGSIGKHHSWEGGLADHTLQVLEFALAAHRESLKWPDFPLRKDLLIVAAVWHDYGKLFDHEKVNGKWQYSFHHRRVKHLPRSVIQFRLYLQGWVPEGLPPEDVLEIEHMILAHHGYKDYGSPIEPQTREAWALHLADMQSVHVLENRKEQPWPTTAG